MLYRTAGNNYVPSGTNNARGARKRSESLISACDINYPGFFQRILLIKMTHTNNDTGDALQRIALG